jgi:hypothetical protein
MMDISDFITLIIVLLLGLVSLIPKLFKAKRQSVTEKQKEPEEVATLEDILGELFGSEQPAKEEKILLEEPSRESKVIKTEHEKIVPKQVLQREFAKFQLKSTSIERPQILSPSELRKAIVFLEILGPPKALKRYRRFI